MVCFIFRDDFSYLGYAEFKNSAVFIHKGYDKSLFITWQRACCRPHMLFYHVTLDIGDISQHDGIFQSDVGVTAAVFRLTLFTHRIISLAVVIEEVVHETCSCRRTCIEFQLAADNVAVVRNIYTVLKTGRSDVMLYSFELFKLR